jgi:hypothetical protein
MSDEKRINIPIPGKRSKRYRLSHGGRSMGSFDTATEALRVYDSHNKEVRPVIDRANEFRYSIMDEQREIAISALRSRAASESKKGG